MSGPSDKAVETTQAALLAMYRRAEGESGVWPEDAEARCAVDAAYPIIRADVIAEVAAVLRAHKEDYPDWWPQDAADFIERKFGGKP